ncbi:hypothetical protein ABGT22_08755 [Peribacillus frigoritolerans]
MSLCFIIGLSCCNTAESAALDMEDLINQEEKEQKNYILSQ